MTAQLESRQQHSQRFATLFVSWVTDHLDRCIKVKALIVEERAEVVEKELRKLANAMRKQLKCDFKDKARSPADGSNVTNGAANLLRPFLVDFNLIAWDTVARQILAMEFPPDAILGEVRPALQEYVEAERQQALLKPLISPGPKQLARGVERDDAVRSCGVWYRQAIAAKKRLVNTLVLGRSESFDDWEDFYITIDGYRIELRSRSRTPSTEYSIEITVAPLCGLFNGRTNLPSRAERRVLEVTV